MGEDAVIDEIYEAAAVPELWPQVLERFAEAAGAVGAVLMSFDDATLRWRASPAFQEHAEAYLAAGFREDQRTTRLVTANQAGFVRDLDVFSVEEWDRDPIRTGFWMPRGLGWGIATKVSAQRGDMTIFHAERRLSDGPGDKATIRRLNLLRPHLARASFLSNRIAFEKIRTAIDTLTAVGLAAVALDPAARVLLANQAFAGAGHIWTTRGGDRLALNDSAADAMLRNSLSATRKTDGPWSIPVRNSAGGVAAVVQLIPIRRSARDLFGRTAVIAVLVEPKGGLPDAAMVQSLFDLTPAEVAVSQALSAGQSPAEIARRTGRSVTTVRNQIKSAMGKTGCSRQVELVLLMRQFVTSPLMSQPDPGG